MDGYDYGGWVLLGLGAYMVAMLYIGWYASRKVTGVTDFVVAGRRLGVLFCTGTLTATWFGSGTCMGGAGNAYLWGNQGVIFDPWGAAVCLILTGFFFARLMRRGRYLTLVDLFDIRYGKAMGLFATTSLVVAEMGWVGAQLVGFGTIIHYFSGIPLEAGIAVSTAILVIYTYLGGMWSVTLTDLFQLLILVVGMAGMLVVAIPLAGGLDGIFSNAPAHNLMGSNQWSFVPTSAADADPGLGNAGFMYYTGHMGWFYWLAAWFALGLGSIPAQDLMQRVLSAKDEMTASTSCYISGLLYCVIGMMPVIIGMVYFHLNPELGIEDAGNKILLRMAVEHLHPLFAVVFVSALVAALMSSADSAILAAASCIGYNGLKYFRPRAGERTMLRATRMAVPLVTAAALFVALYIKVIYNLMVIAWTVLLVSIFVPYASAYFWKKANSAGAIASFFGGLGAWIAMYFVYLPATIASNTDSVPGYEGTVYMEWARWDALYIASVWGLVASAFCMVVISLATQKRSTPRPLCDVDGNLLPIVEWRGLFGRRDAEAVPPSVASE